MLEQKVRKATGEYQEFNREKFEQSLLKSGVPERFVLNLSKQAKKLEGRLVTTDRLFDFAQKKLVHKDKKAAMRYSLKRAMFELGPSGYPFEKFVAQLLRRLGYMVQTNIYIRGYCVSHEVDILARKNKKLNLFECKFHNHRGTKSNIKTALYVKARFDDIERAFQEKTSPRRLAPIQRIYKPWLVTNTKHTYDGRRYASCSGVNIISWGYPRGNSLEELIEKTGLYPITILIGLTRKLKKKLLLKRVVTIEDLVSYNNWRDFSSKEKRLVMKLQKETKLLK